MTKRISTAVLHLNGSKNAAAVHALAVKVFQEMTNNSVTFPGPPFPLVDLQAAIAQLEVLMGEAATGNHQKVEDRNQQSAKVYNMLRSLAGYVNSIAQGDRNIVLLSGFDASDDPSPVPIPDKIIIRRVDRGETPHSAKIHIENPNNEEIFIVQVCDAPLDEASFRTVLQSTSSRRLILENLVKGKEIFIRVAGQNARGQGEWSDPASFIPQ